MQDSMRYKAIRKFGLLCNSDPSAADVIEDQIHSSIPDEPQTVEEFDAVTDLLVELMCIKNHSLN